MTKQTPFFAAFGPLLFGRSPKLTLKKVQAVRSLESLFEMFGDFVPGYFLSREETGKNSRERRLPLRIIFWAFVNQVMDAGSSCRETTRKVEAWWRWLHPQRKASAPMTTSAYCQARARLDLETLALINMHLAWRLEREVLSDEKWLGRSVKIIDGTGISMPDTAENQERWPQPGSQKPGCGFPQMKLVGLFSLSSGALLGHATGSREHESILARQLWSRLHKGDVLIGDRAFGSYAAIAGLQRKGVDSVFRLHQARHADFRAGKRLGANDRLIAWRRPAQRPPGVTAEDYAQLPERLDLRMLRLKVDVAGFRTRSVVVVTTLTDPQKYPASAILDLYGERWQVELHFHQIKTLQQMDILRCKTPGMIEKEVEVHLIAYNLIRCFMQRASHLHDRPLMRISFKGSLDTVRHFATAIHAASAEPKKQETLIAQMLAIIASDQVPHRPGRSEPRARKRRARNYQLLTKPRHLTGNLPRRNRPKTTSAS